MSTARKTKVSLTISEDLLSEIDAYAERSGIGNRSGVVELWLRQASRAQAAARLEQDTISYYARLSAEQRAEDAAWGDAATRALGGLDLD